MLTDLFTQLSQDRRHMPNFQKCRFSLSWWPCQTSYFERQRKEPDNPNTQDWRIWDSFISYICIMTTNWWGVQAKFPSMAEALATM